MICIGMYWNANAIFNLFNGVGFNMPSGIEILIDTLHMCVD